MTATLPTIEMEMTWAYFRVMRMRSLIARTGAALAAAVFLVLAAGPAASAMTASHPTMIQTVDCVFQELTPGDHSMSGHDGNMPCKNMANCPGMLNCSVAAVVPVDAVATLPPAPTGSPSWHLDGAGPGITLEPDNPPPIA